MSFITITVHGMPAPQGSKRHVGRGIMIESSKKVKPWREAVKWAVLQQHEGVRVSGPVILKIAFTLPKPKKPMFQWPATKPDLSKLLRSTEDALTDVGLWDDDSRVIRCEMSKVYPGQKGALGQPGAIIIVLPANEAAS